MLICPAFRMALLARSITEKSLRLVPRKSDKKSAAGTYRLAEDLTVELAPSLATLDRTAWDRTVPPSNFFLSWDYLQAFERTASPALGFYYGQLSDAQGQPLAVFYFQVIHLSAEEIGHILKPLAAERSHTTALLGQWGEWLQRTKDEKGFRMLVSGNNFISGEYGIGMRPGADAETVYRAFCETVKLITGNDRLPAKISAILVKDFFAKPGEIPSDWLRKKRYHRFLVEPEMLVTLPREWKTFDDYLNAMSKKYRNRAKSVYKKSSPLELVEIDAKMAEQHEGELYRLYYNLHERAKFRLAALGGSYFTEMKKRFPENFRIVGYRLNGKLVAFRSSFRCGEHFEAHFIGIDYHYNTEHCLYQRILYDYVAEGLEAGVQQVYLGRTAAEMKSTVGAVAHDLVCYIRHRNGLSNQVIRPFIDYLKPSDWTPRNPFKEEN